MLTNMKGVLDVTDKTQIRLNYQFKGLNIDDAIALLRLHHNMDYLTALRFLNR